MWQSKDRLALSEANTETHVSRNWDLIMQGFLTAIANPKGWAFMISLLPPFIDVEKPLVQQLVVLVAIILTFEFICMNIYATGGKALKSALGYSKNVRLINRISGSLMMAVGVWLFVG